MGRLTIQPSWFITSAAGPCPHCQTFVPAWRRHACPPTTPAQTIDVELRQQTFAVGVGATIGATQTARTEQGKSDRSGES